MRTDQGRDKTIQNELERIRALQLRADYKSAKAAAAKLLKRVPGHFEATYMYAKIVGDYADELPPKAKAAHQKEAGRILSKLIRRLKGQPPQLRYGVQLNFYYNAKRFKDLERFGLRFTAVLRDKGLYAAGAGAALEAERLAGLPAPRARSRAKAAASRGLGYWSKYFELVPRETYYFPYTLVANCHAILGKEREMDRAIGRAARLSKQPLSYWEFEVARKLLAARDKSGK
jgi:hypothetical protein